MAEDDIDLTNRELEERNRGIRIGPWTHNFTRRTHSLDTPGLGGLRWGGRRGER